MNGILTQTLTLPTTLNFRPDSRFSRRPSRFPAKASVRASTATVDREKPAAAMSESLYEVLRVKRNATATEIKTAYRSLAKMYHPDLSDGSDGADFIEIHNAYETLSDPAARAVYDLSIGVGSGNRRMRSDFGFYPTRRWETDQCW